TPVEAARLQGAAAVDDLHAIALVDVHAGRQRAGTDARLTWHGDRRAEVAGVVRAIEGDAAVVRVFGPDEDDVAAAGRAGAVSGQSGAGVGQLRGPRLGGTVEADHVHVVTGRGRRVVRHQAAEMIDVAAVVVGGRAHRVAADQEDAAGRVGVDVLHV